MRLGQEVKTKREATPPKGCRLSSLVLCAQDASEVGLAGGRDEQLWPDLARRVDAFSEDEDSSVDCTLHGDDLALAVAECEVVVEEPAAELVGAYVLVGLRQDFAEGAGCEVSFCCFDGLAEGCDRALGFDFCFGLDACRSFLLESCCELDDDVRVGDHVFDGGRGGVHAVLADGGQDFVSYPCFKLFGCWELGVEDQSVEVAFGDEPGLLDSTWSLKGVVFYHPLQCSLRAFVVSLYPRAAAASLPQKRGVPSSVVRVRMLLFSYVKLMMSFISCSPS